MNTQEKVISAIAYMQGIPSEDVKLDSTIESLDLDSLDTVEIVMAVEEEFDLEILDEDCEAWTTVQSIINYVESRITPVIWQLKR